MIQLTDGLAMTADEHGYMIGKPRQKPGKGIVMDSPTCYVTVAQAAQGALDRAMRKAVASGCVTTLGQFIEEQARQCEEMKKLLAPLEGGNGRQDADKPLLPAVKGTSPGMEKAV